MTYNTKQKDLIYRIIRNEEHEFTIKDIYNKVKSNNVGLTTIYRLVDKLFSDGILNKTIGKDNVTYYQYLEKCDEDNHFYLKCNNCGDIIHIDCDCIESLKAHILSNHKFNLSKEKIIINGICNKCGVKNEKNI